MGKDVFVQQSEKIPFGASFGFEVPENPAFAEFLERTQLNLNVVACVVLQLLIPRIDEVDLVTGTYAGASGIPAVIASANAVTIQSRRTIGHCRRPFANNHPVIGVSRVTTGMAANEVSVLLLILSARSEEIDQRSANSG